MVNKKDMIKFITENAVVSNMNRIELQTMDESMLTKVSDAIAEKIYSIAVKRYRDLDFDTLDSSKGNIEKYSQYKMLVDIIGLLKDLAKPMGDGHPVNVLSLALDNLRENKEMFMRAFKDGLGIGKMTYNLVAKGIIEYAGLLVSTGIELSRKSDGTYQSTYSTRETKDKNMKLLYESLAGFNKAMRDGSLAKCIKDTESECRGITGTTIVVMTMYVMTAYWSAIGIVTLLRHFVYIFYSTKQKYSNIFNSYAILLEMNALKNEDAKSAARQEKLAATFRKVANAMSVDNASKIATDEMSKDEKIDMEEVIV